MIVTNLSVAVRASSGLL